ncbi:hypothetical protein GTW59_35905 [Streptomyces sp. SID89]|nr:hypothetical protein [Streptomyces sp. SID89]
MRLGVGAPAPREGVPLRPPVPPLRHDCPQPRRCSRPPEANPLGPLDRRFSATPLTLGSCQRCTRPAEPGYGSAATRAAARRRW